MNTKPHFSRESDEWETPDDLFQQLHEEFDFKGDLCATSKNAKLPYHFGYLGDGEFLDALEADRWFDCNFMNPPYSRCEDFVAQAAMRTVVERCTTVMLLPVRTDTRWFHSWIWNNLHHRSYSVEEVNHEIEVRLLRGRVKFTRPGKKSTSAPFPSMIVVFKPYDKCS